MGPNPNQPVDRTVPVLRIDATGRHAAGRAVRLRLPCRHAGRRAASSSPETIPSFARQGIEQRLPGVQAMFVAGCGADANPDPRGGAQQEEWVRRHGQTPGRGGLPGGRGAAAAGARALCGRSWRGSICRCSRRPRRSGCTSSPRVRSGNRTMRSGCSPRWRPGEPLPTALSRTAGAVAVRHRSDAGGDLRRGRFRLRAARSKGLGRGRSGWPAIRTRCSAICRRPGSSRKAATRPWASPRARSAGFRHRPRT